MFATLASGYTRLPRAGATDHLGDARRLASRGEFDPRGLWVIENTLIKEIVTEQAEAGLELLTDGLVRWVDELGSFVWALRGSHVAADGRPRFDREPEWLRPVSVESFRFLRSLTDQPVRMVLLGPFTLARASDPGPLTRERLTITLADALAREIRELVAAGCQVIQVDEPAAVSIESDADRALFRAAHRRLTHAVGNAHLMLSVLGGNVDGAGARTIFDAPYHSYLFDLLDQPDNWLLAAQAPPSRGVIAGIGATGPDDIDDEERIRWAAMLLAAMRGRGPDRVGIAPAGSLDGLPRDVARARIDVLGGVALDLFEQAQAGDLPADPQALARAGAARGWFGRLSGDAVEEARTRELAPADGEAGAAGVAGDGSETA